MNSEKILGLELCNQKKSLKNNIKTLGPYFSYQIIQKPAKQKRRRQNVLLSKVKYLFENIFEHFFKNLQNMILIIFLALVVYVRTEAIARRNIVKTVNLEYFFPTIE